MKPETILKSYNDAKEYASNVFDTFIANVNDNNYDNNKYGSCQCKCGETMAYWFYLEDIEDSIQIGVCEVCGK